MFEKYKKYIRNEVLGEKRVKDENLTEKYLLNDEEVFIKVERL